MNISLKVKVIEVFGHIFHFLLALIYPAFCKANSQLISLSSTALT